VENWYNKKNATLAPDEIEKLRAMNLGYGNFAANARRLRMHPNTYRYILDRGHGTQENINIIRAVLLPGYENSPYQPTADQAG